MLQQLYVKRKVLAGLNSRIVAVLLGVIMVSTLGCHKDKTTDWEPYYRYFPTSGGHWLLYEVDSTVYNKLQDTILFYHYKVRETIGEEFCDLTGDKWQRIDHEVFRDSVTGWVSEAVYAQRRTKNTGERIENNMKFTRMIFPFSKYTYWNGNSYIHYEDVYNCNFWGDWEYRYTDLFRTTTIGTNVFDSVVTIRQVADSGLICKSVWTEMYAPGIGMIQRYVERLTTQKTTPDPFYVKAENGYILSYKLVGWKTE
jgi:hypothetical protein